MNECEETNGGCEALCCNTIGSFYCRCPPGLKLNEDGKTCQGEFSVAASNSPSVSFMLVRHSKGIFFLLTFGASVSKVKVILPNLNKLFQL